MLPTQEQVFEYHIRDFVEPRNSLVVDLPTFKIRSGRIDLLTDRFYVIRPMQSRGSVLEEYRVVGEMVWR
jgi:hypothetical protein